MGIIGKTDAEKKQQKREPVKVNDEKPMKQPKPPKSGKKDGPFGTSYLK